MTHFLVEVIPVSLCCDSFLMGVIVGQETAGQHLESGEEKGLGVPISVQPGYNASFPTFYANFASVSHTGEDLCLDFCIVAPPHNILPERQALVAPVTARVIIPPRMARGLVEALNQQLTKQSQELTQGSIIVSDPSQEIKPHG